MSREELAQHASPEDAWGALHGRVYNLTPYLRFHPGGVAVLTKAAGRDMTDLFNKYHPWVNAAALMERCLIGRLAPAAGGGRSGGSDGGKTASTVPPLQQQQQQSSRGKPPPDQPC